MDIQILNSTPADLPTIFEFYDYAVEHQIKAGTDQWKGFDRKLVQQEIEEQRQYKVLMEQQVACVFMVTFADPQIWPDRSGHKAIYLHRIVTHPNFRGHSLMRHVTDWALKYARAEELDFIRMDTWANNQKLVGYYKTFGFKDAGQIAIGPNSGLPKHYEGITLQLFEIKVA